MDPYEAAKSVVATLREHGHTALLAGGCVRDMLLGQKPKDYDVATDAAPDRVCALFRRTKQVGAKFGVVLAYINRVEVEVATFRTEGEYLDGRRPQSVTFTSQERDAERRDFTINGMFYDPFDDRVVDHVGGRHDLEARIIRCIGDPARRFAEDHLRMLRAVRFAARLEFTIDEATFAAMRQHAARISDISAERIRMELEQILTSRSRARGWRLVFDSGLADHIVPGVRWAAEDAARIERILAALPESPSTSLPLAALLADRPDERVEDACGALRCSNEATKAVRFLVANAGRLPEPREMELADLKRLMSSGYFDELLALGAAIIEADGLDASPLERIRNRAAKIPEEQIAPPPLVTGDDLAALGLRPGPAYARILGHIYREQLNNRISARREAMSMARRMIAEED